LKIVVRRIELHVGNTIDGRDMQHAEERRENACRSSVGKFEGKRSLERPRPRWKANIKKDNKNGE
jgi:hypothetical protein